MPLPATPPTTTPKDQGTSPFQSPPCPAGPACPPKPEHRRGLHITARDLAVMDTLARYGLVREATLHALHFPLCKHQKHVQHVLKRLADRNYIGRRFLPPIHRLNTMFLDYSRPDRTGAIYFLAQDGAALLGVPYNPNAPRVKLAYLHHRLDIGDVRACFELAVSRSEGLSLAAWIGENDKDEDGRFLLHDQVQAEDPDTDQLRRLPIRPDACLVLEEEHIGQQACLPAGEAGPPKLQRRREVFFVEVDEGTESGRKRWRDKVLAYRAYAREGFDERFADSNRGLPAVASAKAGFRVLTISRTPSGTRTEKRLATLLAATAAAHGRKQFWFTTWDQVMPDGRPTGEHILSSPVWRRAGAAADEPHILADFLFDRDQLPVRQP